MRSVSSCSKQVTIKLGWTAKVYASQNNQRCAVHSCRTPAHTHTKNPERKYICYAAQKQRSAGLTLVHNMTADR